MSEFNHMNFNRDIRGHELDMTRERINTGTRRINPIPWAKIKAFCIVMLIPLGVVFIPYYLGKWNWFGIIPTTVYGRMDNVGEIWACGLLSTLIIAIFSIISGFCLWGLWSLYQNLVKKYE